MTRQGRLNSAHCQNEVNTSLLQNNYNNNKYGILAILGILDSATLMEH